VHRPSDMAYLLLDLALVLVLCRVFGTLARWVKQPAVVGEIVLGILIGPTLLPPQIGEAIIPPDVRPALEVLADVGIALFMFVLGMGIEHALLRGTGRVTSAVVLCATALPFGLGALLGLLLAGRHAGDSPLGYVLFMGLAMSVTAFPVLARIIADAGLTKTMLGSLALSSAAVGDALAWSLLTIVVLVSGTANADARVTLLAIPYLAVMLLLRPLLRRLLAAGKTRAGRDAGAGTLAWPLGGLLVSAAATEALHLHFIFGAFLFGLIIPRDGSERLRRMVADSVEPLSRSLLIPVYFVVAGLNVDLRRLDLSEVGELLLLIVVAMTGKFGGAWIGARSQGVPRLQALALSTLMNARGLTELVMLGTGLSLGLIDRSTYSMMVVMAVITTAMTGPLLQLIGRRTDLRGPPAERAPMRGSSSRTTDRRHGTGPPALGPT
jgi:Kef-type K+ transport system membrane component KefB